MKKEAKSELQLQAEKEELERLVREIKEMTNRIPAKILNSASYQAAVTFKELAFAARKAAESSRPQLAKLRSAYSSISAYY